MRFLYTLPAAIAGGCAGPHLCRKLQNVPGGRQTAWENCGKDGVNERLCDIQVGHRLGGASRAFVGTGWGARRRGGSTGVRVFHEAGRERQLSGLAVSGQSFLGPGTNQCQSEADT